MLNQLLQSAVQRFIQDHKNDSVEELNRLLLNKAKHRNIPISLVVNQIKARQKAKAKLPLWYQSEGVIMPPLLSMEQSSSQEAATYKSKLFSGNLAIDLTGGAGIDAYFLAKQFNNVIYIEINKELAELASHNFKILGVRNIEVIHANSEVFISSFSEKADLIYIDPARRDQNKKLFLFEDCAPKIIALQHALSKVTNRILVKASPMLDITKGVNQLTNIAEVQVIAIKNEVKELLFIQEQKPPKNIKIRAIDLANHQQFSCDWSNSEKAKLGEIATYLYEPNAAILKTGKADVLSNKFNLQKLHPNTNLFTSTQLEEDFPGRTFVISNVLKYDKTEIRKNLPDLKANIATRNFPDSVDKFKKKVGVKDGGNTYLFGIGGLNNKPKVIICSKI